MYIVYPYWKTPVKQANNTLNPSANSIAPLPRWLPLFRMGCFILSPSLLEQLNRIIVPRRRRSWPRLKGVHGGGSDVLAAQGIHIPVKAGEVVLQEKGGEADDVGGSVDAGLSRIVHGNNQNPPPVPCCVARIGGIG